MIEAGDVTRMRRALNLARLGPVADPNPRVGAVVVDDTGGVVGEGYHRGAGSPHAEAVALVAAGAAAAGATVFVTLEPCNHTGRTGPCSRALAAAGVSRVVYSQSDPNATASGGAESLRDAGVQVEGGLLAAEAAELNQAWTFAMVRGRPRVVWKFAASLDGRSAAADGTSRWITGPAARADVHALRGESGAVLVGTGTVLADDPALTVRGPDGARTGRQPLRVVMGRRVIPPAARVLDDSAPTLQLQDPDPGRALAALAAREIRQVWLEGGPTLAAAFLRAGLVDEVVAYLAPMLLGDGPSAVAGFGIPTMDAALRLNPYDVITIGPDIRVRATLPSTGQEGH